MNNAGTLKIQVLDENGSTLLAQGELGVYWQCHQWPDWYGASERRSR